MLLGRTGGIGRSGCTGPPRFRVAERERRFEDDWETNSGVVCLSYFLLQCRRSLLITQAALSHEKCNVMVLSLSTFQTPLLLYSTGALHTFA